ncbi:hypothetical protein BC940DRAFT_115325 [Gongronella butleri]|nr:hypothetical protein BC940DRAFT_115325 [Gongronella butleri]
MIPHGQYRPPRPSSSMSNRSNRSATLKPAYVASSPVPIPSISSNSHRSGTGGGAARAVAAAVGAAMSSLQPGSAATPPPPPTRATTTLGGASATAMSANARRSPLFDEPFDQHVNPWANQAPMPVPPNAQQPQQPLSLSSSTATLSPLDRRILQQQHHHAATSTASSSPILGSSRLRTLQSPLQHHPPSMTQPGSSNSSTITATTANVRSMSASYYRQQQATPTPASVQQQQQQLQQQQQQQQPPSRAQINDYAYASVVSLGPATRRALESLQAEIIALNERVDDIRHEVLRRNQLQGTETRWPVAPPAEGDGSDDWEGWKWVIKAALKHAAVNLLTMLLVLWILHKRGSPAAVAVVGHFAKLWQKVRTHFRLITVIV